MTVEAAQAPILRDTREHAAAYRWLAGVFAREFTAEAIAVYRRPEGAALLTALGALPALAPLVETLRDRFATDAPAKEIAHDLAGAYARLFHGVGGRKSAPLCASFYQSPNARMMQADAGETQAALDALDLRLAADMREPPDHIAVQLAVMSHLAETACDSTQADWLAQRLAPWLGAFATRCAQVPRAGPYAIAARAAATFCADDLAELRGAS